MLHLNAIYINMRQCLYISGYSYGLEVGSIKQHAGPSEQKKERKKKNTNPCPDAEKVVEFYEYL